MNFTLDEIKLAMFNTLVDMGREDDTDDIILSTLQGYILLLDTLRTKKSKDELTVSAATGGETWQINECSR